MASDKNTVVSRTDYLPFGVRMTGNGLTESTTARSVWFGFSGKENELWNAQSSTSHWVRGERYQYFGARYYDPVVCVFMQIDPATEEYFSMSPYNYCVGNPIITIDPNGRKPRIYIQKYVHKYGHVFVTTGEDENTLYYTHTDDTGLPMDHDYGINTYKEMGY